MSADNKEMSENWPILVVAFVLVFFAFGVPTFSLPLMYVPAMEEFGWSNTQVNLISTAKFLMGAVAALGMGIMVDKTGGKTAVLIGTFTGGVAMALFYFATSLPVYYLVGVLLGLSASSIVAAMKVVISRLFHINQGLAIGIVLGATSFGSVVMPLVWGPLLDSGMNWRSIFAMLSLGSFFIATPLWVIFMSRTGTTQEVINASVKSKDGEPGMWEHFREISKDRGFWFLGAAIFLASAVDQAMMQNYVSFLRLDRGLVPRDFFWLISFISILAVAAKIGSGWFYDRFSIPGIRVFYFLLAVSVILALPVAGLLTMALFLTVRNIAHGGMIVEAPILTKHYLGPRNLGLTIGLVSVCVNLGFAAGPPLLGYFYDVNGNYTMGIIVFAIVALVGTLLLIPVKPRYWTPPASRKKSAAADSSVEGIQPAGA